MPRKQNDPLTPEQWQEAVDAAAFLLNFDSARKYGLLTGGPGIDAQRCAYILRAGKKRGFRPAPFEQLCEKFIESEGTGGNNA